MSGCFIPVLSSHQSASWTHPPQESSTIQIYFCSWWIFKAWWTLNECMFYHFTIFWTVVNLDLKYQLGESSPNYINAVMNLYLLLKEKRWTDDECWSNDFYEKVNRGEDLRRVSSRCQLMAAWYKHNTCLVIFS